MDQVTTIATLRALVEKFVSVRNWAQFHSPKNLSMGIAVEAAELMDLFKWCSREESVQLMRRGRARTAAADEIADIVIYCLAFANRTGIDISEAVKRKVSKNRRKYPVRKFAAPRQR